MASPIFRSKVQDELKQRLYERRLEVLKSQQKKFEIQTQKLRFQSNLVSIKTEIIINSIFYILYISLSIIIIIIINKI